MAITNLTGSMTECGIPSRRFALPALRIDAQSCRLAGSALVAMALLSGCVTTSDAPQTAVRTAPADPMPVVPAENPLHGAIGELELGGDGLAHDSRVSADGLQSRLKDQLAAAGMLGAPETARYRLFVTLHGIDEPWSGAAVTMTADADYELVELETGETIHQASTSGDHTVPWSESPFFMNRVNLARDGALAETISDLVAGLHDVDQTLLAEVDRPFEGPVGVRRDTALRPAVEAASEPETASDRDPEPTSASPGEMAVDTPASGSLQVDPSVPDDSDRARLARVLERQADELARLAERFPDLRDRMDRLRGDLARQYGIDVSTFDSIDDNIASAVVSYCWQQYGEAAWSDDPWGMEERCENELQRSARPAVEAYFDADEELWEGDRRYSELREEHEALQESIARWQQTGEMDETLTAALEAPEPGASPAGDGDLASLSGECARKEGKLDQFGDRVMSVIRGSNDDCDFHLANFLMHLWAYDLARICHEAGSPDHPASMIADLRGSIQGMSAQMDQMDRMIGCRYDRRLTEARNDWGPVPY